MLRRLFLIILSALLLATVSICGIAQAPDNLTIFSKRDGLPSDYISAVLRDSRGFLWVATPAGLSRYDGYTFTTFRHDPRDTTTIAGNSTTSICEDTSGRIWVGTANNGLSVYNPTTGRFKNYGGGVGLPLRHGSVFKLYRDRSGVIWAGLALQGVARYEARGDSFRHFLPAQSPLGRSPNVHPNSIGAMYDDGRGNLWLGSGNGLHRLRLATGAVETLQPPGKLPSSFTVTDLWGEGGDHLYIGTWGLGIFCYNIRLGDWRQSNYKPYSEAGNANIVSRIAPKDADELYLACADTGLAIYRKSDGSLRFPDFSRRDMVGWTTTAYTDPLGATWVGTLYKGLLYLPPSAGAFRALPIPVKTHGKHVANYWASNIIQDAAGGAGHYYAIPWAGTGVLYTRDNFNTWSFFPFPDAPRPLRTRVSAALDENSKLWIARPEGILSYSSGANNLVPETFKKESGELLNSAYDVEPDRRGELYFINDDGLWRTSDGIARRLAPRLATQNGENDMRSLFLDSRGTLWILTYYNGLARYNAQSGRIELFLPQPGDRASSPSRGINDITEAADGTLYLATTTSGISTAHVDDLGRVRFKDFPRNADINEIVWSIDADKSGRIVFSTEEVLYLYDTKRGLLRDWGKEEGLPFSYYREAVQFGPEGDIIFGSSHKVYRLQPSASAKGGKGPAVFLASLHVNGKPVDEMQQSGVTLRHTQNFLSFEMVAPQAAIGGAAMYSYKLDGYDKKWSTPTTRRFGSYTGLPPGKYSLRVRAAGEDGIWREAEGPLWISIEPAFWQRWWFIALVASGLLTIAFFAVRYRRGVLRERERLKSDYNKRLAEVEMRALRAQMNPHFLFNCLNSINRFVLMSDPDTASDYLTRFARLIRLILDNSKQDTVALDDELEALELYISMESLRFEHRFRAHIQVAPNVPSHSVQVPPLLLQPFVENAIWHGLMHKEGEGDVWIDVARQNGHLRITIEDNGIGRAQAAAYKDAQTVKRKSHGLQITTDRLSMLNTLTERKAEVSVDDLHDESGQPNGTRVTLLLPLFKDTSA